MIFEHCYKNAVKEMKVMQTGFNQLKLMQVMTYGRSKEIEHLILKRAFMEHFY